MYLNHFGLRHLPFACTPDIEFFLDYGEFKDGLDMLTFSMSASDGIIKITGESGVGKTVLCQKLRNSLDDRFFITRISNPSINSRELYQAFAYQIGIRYRTNLGLPRLLECIDARLKTLHEEERHVVLLVDEAQGLSNESLEVLRLLSNFETEKNKLLQVVLFGQSELDDRLRQVELRQVLQRIDFSHTLNSLTEEAVDVYIQHRLHVAGHRGMPIFCPKALKLLYSGSQGVPRMINILAHKAMLVAFSRGCAVVSAQHVRRAINDTDCADKRSRSFAAFYSLLGWSKSSVQVSKSSVVSR